MGAVGVTAVVLGAALEDAQGEEQVREIERGRAIAQ